MERFKMIASGYVLFVRGGKILLLLRKNTGYMDGWYSLPAGHIEDNESLTSGTCREIAEEVGVKLRPKDITLVHLMHRKEGDIRMDFFFEAPKFFRDPKNMEPEKCEELRWFPMSHLPKNTIPYIRAAINFYRKKVFFSERGWN